MYMYYEVLVKVNQTSWPQDSHSPDAILTDSARPIAPTSVARRHGLTSSTLRAAQPPARLHARRSPAATRRAASGQPRGSLGPARIRIFPGLRISAMGFTSERIRVHRLDVPSSAERGGASSSSPPIHIPKSTFVDEDAEILQDVFLDVLFIIAFRFGSDLVCQFVKLYHV